MRTIAFAMLPAALLLSGPAPLQAQSAAPQPQLTAEAAIQLFEEAGFPLRDGRPVNRCGRASNPRIAFVDLNADGGAEAHIGDVDPDCYGTPGAYFAILAQQPDLGWKRLIAEDGIVGFEASRSSGWNDLSLEPRDSACPGLRRFNGTDYGAPTACSPHSALADAGVAAGEAEAAAATGVAGPAEPLTGSRAEQLAQLLTNLIPVTLDRSWEAALAAFPGATLYPRATHRAWQDGSTVSHSGEITLAGAPYTFTATGTPDRINSITINGPDDDNLVWAEIESALRAGGTGSDNIGCHSPTGFGWVRLTADGQTAIMHKFVNYGTMVPSTDIYSFTPGNPLDGRTEAEVARDRSMC